MHTTYFQRLTGLAAAAFVMLLAFILRPLLTVLVGIPLLIKFFVTVLLVFPAGFTMGMPFPMGLKLLERWHRPSVRWAWSLNAAASVVGSAGSIFCAIYLGLMQTLLAGVALYGAALAVSAIATPATRAQG